MFYGFGQGFGSRGGMEVGFRGSSPPWPYVGLGRGGLPRCGYFLSGAAGVPEQELNFLKDQAEAIKGQLEQIEARIKELKSKKE